MSEFARLRRRGNFERGLYRVIVRPYKRGFRAHIVIPSRDESCGLNSNPWELEFIGENAVDYYALRNPARAAAKAVRAIGTHVERVEIDYDAVLRDQERAA